MFTKKSKEKIDFALFTFRNNDKIKRLIQETWYMQNSGQKTQRHKILRMEVLRRAETSKCIGGHEDDLLKLENDDMNRTNMNRIYIFQVQLS